MEDKLPHDQVCPSVGWFVGRSGWLVGWSVLKVGKFHFHAPRAWKNISSRRSFTLESTILLLYFQAFIPLRYIGCIIRYRRMGSRPPVVGFLIFLLGLGRPAKFYIREYTSGNLRKHWSQGYCVQTALNTSFALLSQLENRRQLCVCFDSKVSC